MTESTFESSFDEGVNVSVRLSPVLKRFFPVELFAESRLISIERVRTVAEALTKLVNLCADEASQDEIKRHLYEESNNTLGRLISVYVEDEDIQYGGGLETELADGQEVALHVPTAGGLA